MEDARFQDIMARVQAGSQPAMDALLIASYGGLRGWIEQKLSKTLKDAQVEAEDVIQEVYAAAWERVSQGRFESLGAFEGWLRQIAENKLIDLHRAVVAGRRDVRRQSPAWGAQGGTYVNLLDQVSSPLSTPSRGAARHEALAVLMVRMQQLPEDYRQVLQWRLIEGEPVAEVARRMERSEAAIHMLCHRALKQLRELMGQPSDYLTQT